MSWFDFAKEVLARIAGIESAERKKAEQLREAQEELEDAKLKQWAHKRRRDRAKEQG